MSAPRNHWGLVIRYCPLFTSLVLAGFASDVCGQLLTVDPPNPLDTTPVTLTVAHWCACGCCFDCHAVGSWVGPWEYYVEWHNADTGATICPPVCVELVQQFDLGILAIGDYRLAVTECRYTDPSASCQLGTPWWCENAETVFHVYSVCDFDLDTDVDAFDFAEFRACFHGPNIASGDDCTQADVDSDDDTDLRDFAVVQTAFTG